MDPKSSLEHEKAKLLGQIEESAKQGRSQEVIAFAEKLNRIESLIERNEKLLREVSELSDSDSGKHALGVSRAGKTKRISKPDVVSGKDIGKIIRAIFLKRASDAGIDLEHIGGSIYKNKSGKKVGVAVATERNPDRWFLGLPNGSFDHAVLLCKPDVGSILEICLPHSFFHEYGQTMSQSGGQTLFNVARRGNGYFILVPRTDGISLSKFLSNYLLLK